MVALVGVWQAANGVGFVWEWIRSRRSPAIGRD
jgi:hypothetical protein